MRLSKSLYKIKHMIKNWNGKRYYSLDYYLKENFNEKIYKISLNGGMTCPNRNGSIDSRGCIFCSSGGSGDFAQNPSLSITSQLENGKKLLCDKYPGHSYIAYFQAYTNTYAPVEYLREIFTQAIIYPDTKILSIATRPDCIDDSVLSLLSELNKIKPVWVELGLQTIHKSTSDFIRRGYELECFENTLTRLNDNNIDVIVHTILGLPNETKDNMLETIDYLAHKNIQGIKLQLLHILKETDLFSFYRDNPFYIMNLEEYCDLITCCIEHLPQNVVIHRITGDGPKALLIAPTWSLNKRKVLNSINHAFKLHDSWQGKLFKY